MKHILLLIIILISISAFGQKKKKVQDDLYSVPEKKTDFIPKNANTIIITDTLSQELYFNKITDVLFENGYGILNSDKVQGTITTSERSFKNGDIKLNILIKDKKVLLRGDYKFSMSISLYGATSEPSWTGIQNMGMKNSVNINAWNEMMKIADGIPGKKEYLIR